MGEKRGVYGVLVRKPEGKRPAGRLRRRWEDDIKMDLQEVELGGGDMDWIDVAENRHRRQAKGSCEYGNEPSGSIKCREFLD